MREEDDRAERAARRRRTMTVRMGTLDDQASTIEGTTAEERIAMIWEITKDAWELSGREMPDYARSEAPVRWLRLEDLEPST